MNQSLMPRDSISPAYLLKGFSLLTHREIRGFVIFPLLINLLLFIGLGLYAANSFSAALDSLMAYIPEWLGFLSWLLWILFGALMLLVYGYSFALIGNIIASPFYGLLSEKVAALNEGEHQGEPFSWRGLAVVAGKSFRREVVKLLYFIPRILGVLLLTLILSFIPLINVAGPVIAFLWGSWSLSLQYLDYPADNNQQSFSLLRQQAGKKRLTSLGFGGAVLLTTSIPLLNMLAIPASVIGGTLLWQDQIREDVA